MKLHYEKPQLIDFNATDIGIVHGQSLPPPSCLIPALAPSGRRANAKPLILDAKGNPIIYQK